MSQMYLDYVGLQIETFSEIREKWEGEIEVSDISVTLEKTLKYKNLKLTIIEFWICLNAFLISPAYELYVSFFIMSTLNIVDPLHNLICNQYSPNWIFTSSHTFYIPRGICRTEINFLRAYHNRIVVISILPSWKKSERRNSISDMGLKGFILELRIIAKLL